MVTPSPIYALAGSWCQTLSRAAPCRSKQAAARSARAPVTAYGLGADEQSGLPAARGSTMMSHTRSELAGRPYRTRRAGAAAAAGLPSKRNAMPCSCSVVSAPCCGASHTHFVDRCRTAQPNPATGGRRCLFGDCAEPADTFHLPSHYSSAASRPDSARAHPAARRPVEWHHSNAPPPRSPAVGRKQLLQGLHSRGSTGGAAEAAHCRLQPEDPAPGAALTPHAFSGGPACVIT
jgi:hypothetical protein